MKKLIILALVLVPVIGFCATQITKEIKSYEAVAQIHVLDNRPDIFVYKYQEASTTCFVATQTVAGMQSNLSISCK